MRILMVSPFSPFPPHSGGHIRIWEKIMHLGLNHQVTLVALGYSDADFEVPIELHTRCAEIIIVPYQEPVDVFPPRLPNRIRAYYCDALRDVLCHLKEKMFDLVMLEHIYVAQYATIFRGAVVLEEQNIESSVLKRFAGLRGATQEMIAPETYTAKAFRDAGEQWKLLQDYENATWPNFPLRITVSESDKREIERRCRSGRTIVVENGTNLAKMRWLPAVGKPNILFMGTLEYYPNLDAVVYFVQEILPRVWMQEPTARFYIAGRNPPQAITTLARDTRITVIPNPEDMSVVASNCRVSVVPLRFGGGTRLKILDAMAMGLPVVSTSIGCEGLPVKNWRHLAIHDTAEEFAEAIVLVCRRDELYQQLRCQARQLVETRCEWRKVFERLDGELERLVELHRQPACFTPLA